MTDRAREFNSALFMPIAKIRCPPDSERGGESKGDTYLGKIGYYDGVLVIRYRCNSYGCKWMTDDHGDRHRVVTIHYDALMTGERVADERRPYKGPGFSGH